MWSKFIRDWTNHTKEGVSRTKQDLIVFDEVWNKLIKHIKEVEKKDSLSEEDEYLISQVKYIGKITRIHQKFTKEHPFGVISSEHRLSWTSQEDLSQIYWMNNSKKYLFITAEATEDNFGISLIGLQNYLNKYYYESYSLGSPAILKEQEVVFPLYLDNVLNMEIESVNERNKKAGQSH